LFNNLLAFVDCHSVESVSVSASVEIIVHWSLANTRTFLSLVHEFTASPSSCRRRDQTSFVCQLQHQR
jgi:hypothetical protein